MHEALGITAQFRVVWMFSFRLEYAARCQDAQFLSNFAETLYIRPKNPEFILVNNLILIGL